MPRRPRFDFASLARAISREPVTDAELALLLRVDRRQIQRARQYGLGDIQADRWAIAAGTLPEVVWSDYLEPAYDPESESLPAKVDRLFGELRETMA